MQMNRRSSGTLSEQRDIIWVTAKIFDILFHPLERYQLIFQAHIPSAFWQTEI